MSLNAKEKEQTRIELNENYRILDIDPTIIQADLKLSPEQLRAALNVGPVPDPTVVWRLRDYMEEKIREQGKEPYPYTILNNNIYFKYEKDW